MLMHNFAHADLHPGNLIIRRKDKVVKKRESRNGGSPTMEDIGLELVVLDCGLVARLPPEELKVIISMLHSTLQGHYKEATEIFLSTCAEPPRILQPDVLKDKVTDFVRRIHRRQLEGGMTYLESLSGLAAIRREHRFTMRSNYSSLIVGSLVVEGTCQGRCNVVESLVKLFEGTGSELLDFYIALTEGQILSTQTNSK